MHRPQPDAGGKKANFMKKALLIITTVALTLAAGIGDAAAENRNDGKKRKGGGVKLSTEWGFVAGVSYPWLNYDTQAFPTLQINPKMGVSAGFHMALKFGKTLALQPELIYTYSPIRMRNPAEKFSSRIKAQTLQVPVLFSVRFWVMRLNVGPVITLMDNPTYRDNGGEKVMFGRIYPTFSYTAGASVCVLRHLLIDLRYNGRFNKSSNFVSYDASHEGFDIKTSTHNVQLKIGYLF